MKKYFLFDLDGTLTDTGEGIMKSVQYALEAYGIREDSEEKLRRFVGPPLHKSFQAYYGFSEEQSLEAVEKYRERYRVKGVFESPLYPGVKEMLERLFQRGVLCLATSKPIFFAEQILKMREIAPYFTVTVGANLDGTMTDKAQVIGRVLNQLGDPPAGETVMIGDREHDVFGARANGLESVGVRYGYAPPGELEAAGAEYVAATVQELEELLLSMAQE